MTEIFVVHRHDPRNIGDMWSSPSQYTEHFPWLADATTIDIEDDIPAYADRLRDAHVIYGGGGLIATGFFDRQLAMLLDLRPKKLVAWGAGHNDKAATRVEQPAYVEKFDLAGLRDHGSPTWVPCVSALLPQLSDPADPSHDLVVYQHWDERKRPPLPRVGVPVLKNSNNDIGETIAFLASGRTVVTNSYHGAYWATLLGRRVVVVNPFSSKFHAFKHEVPLAGDDWEAALHRAVVHDGALAECRARNLEFGARVQEFFGA